MPFEFSFWSTEQATQDFDIFSQVMDTRIKDVKPYDHSQLDESFAQIQQSKFDALKALDCKNYEAAMSFCDLALELTKQVNDTWVQCTQDKITDIQYKRYITHCELAEFLSAEIKMIREQANRRQRNYLPIKINSNDEHLALKDEIQNLKFAAMNLGANGNLPAALAKYELISEHKIPNLNTAQKKWRRNQGFSESNLFIYPLAIYLSCEISALRNKLILVNKWKNSPDRNIAITLIDKPIITENIDVLINDLDNILKIYESHEECFYSDDEAIFIKLKNRKSELELLLQKKQTDDRLYQATQKLDEGEILESLKIIVRAKKLNPQNYISEKTFTVAIEVLGNIYKTDYEPNKILFAKAYAASIYDAVIKKTTTAERGKTVLFSTHKTELKTTIENCIKQYWKKFYARPQPTEFADKITTIIVKAVKDINPKKWLTDRLFFRLSNTSINNAESVLEQIKREFIEYAPTIQIPRTELALLEPYRQAISEIPFATPITMKKPQIMQQ